MTTRKVHLCQSIKGPLMNWTKRDWKAARMWITKPDGSKYLTGDDLKAAFLEELSKGHEVVPIGDCDNFDYEHGCMGHLIGDKP